MLEEVTVCSEIWNSEKYKLWNALNDVKYHLYSNL